MAISQQLQERIEALAAELRYEVHGPRGCPPWGTKFVDMEQETTEIGDAIHAFGKQLAAAAWQRGFAAAPRKAFVGDGQDANWSVWRRHFSHYTPILDFIHAICYVFAAAVAGRPLQFDHSASHLAHGRRHQFPD